MTGNILAPQIPGPSDPKSKIFNTHRHTHAHTLAFQIAIRSIYICKQQSQKIITSKQCSKIKTSDLINPYPTNVENRVSS